MKKRITTFLRQVLETVKHAPAESALAIFFCICYALVTEDVNPFQRAYIFLYPLFFTFTFLLNCWFPSGHKRWIYYLSPLLAIPFFWANVEHWMEQHTIQYWVAVGLCPFLIFICRWRRNNTTFIADGLHYIKNLAFAGLLSLTGFLLTLAIYYSVDFIFPALNLDGWDEAINYFSLFFYWMVLPLVFLTFVRQQKEGYRPVAFLDVMVNFVVTPALLVYTGILYAYFLKILFTWTLPVGGIAYMVFAFTLVAVLVKAYQPLVARRRYDWFFNRFGLIALPALVMFWIGVGYRIAQYGLTEDRIYLLICGVLMTVAVLMFFAPRVARYLYLTVLGIALFSIFTFIPGVSAEDIALRAQTARFEKAAAGLGMLAPDGKIIDRKLPPADSITGPQYEKVYAAFKYLYYETPDGVLKARYGISAPAHLSENVLPENIHNGYYYNPKNRDELAEVPYEDRYGFVDYYRGDEQDRELSFDTRGFSRLYKLYGAYDPTPYSTRTPYDSDSIYIYLADTLPVVAVSYADVQAAQFAKLGIPDTASIKEMQERNNEMLIYDYSDRYRLLFASMRFQRDSTLRIVDLSVDWLLER